MIQHLLMIALFAVAGSSGPVLQQAAGEQASPYIERTRKQFVFFPGGRFRINEPPLHRCVTANNIHPV